MNFDLHIIPECYIDTKLIKILVPPQTRYNHQKGCSTVVKVMKERFGDEFAVGIIDRDKKELAYTEECSLVYEKSEHLQLFKHKNKPHYLIFICPAMEKWIVASADEASINLNNYGLPHNFKALQPITKTATSEDKDVHSENFKNLFKALKDSNSANVAVLKFWVEYLKINNYSTNIDLLKTETEQILNT